MDKWTRILLEVEGMWEADAYAQYLGQTGCDPQTYRIERDTYKAERIHDLYGYEYFLNFVQRCPHIKGIVKVQPPCKKNGGQCTLFCYYYGNGGCTYATE